MIEICPRCRRRLEDEWDEKIQPTLIKVDDRQIRLTHSEAAIFELLLFYEGKIVSMDRLVYNLYESGLRLPYRKDTVDYKTPDKSIQVFIHKIRKKIAGTVLLIETVPGTGYVLRGGEHVSLFSSY